MERGYLGDRFSFTSLGWNGLNGYADFGSIQVDPVERFQNFHAHAFRPWDPTGEYAVIMGQVPGDASLRGQVMDGWYRQKACDIHDSLGIPVYFRPHPEALKKGHRIPTGLTVIDGDLSQVISGARLVATYNSNSAVDALIAGKPVELGDRGSMAWELVGDQIFFNEPDGRLEWAQNLSARQWLLEEMASGVALTGLIDRFEV